VAQHHDVLQGIDRAVPFAVFFRFAHEAFITSDIRFLSCSSSDGRGAPGLLALIAAAHFEGFWVVKASDSTR
jgi:MYXO-CTERM domain-containing protein